MKRRAATTRSEVGRMPVVVRVPGLPQRLEARRRIAHAVRDFAAALCSRPAPGSPVLVMRHPAQPTIGVSAWSTRETVEASIGWRAKRQTSLLLYIAHSEIVLVLNVLLTGVYFPGGEITHEPPSGLFSSSSR